MCTSCQVKRVAVLDLTGHINRQVCVLTIDTCRMPEETYLIIDYARHRHHLAVEVFAPDADYVADLVRSNWPNPICQSVPLRMACCEANKSVPSHELSESRGMAEELLSVAVRAPSASGVPTRR